MISFLGLGSNEEDRLYNLNRAIELLSKDENIQLVAKSSFYESPPLYNVSLNAFLNGVIKVNTSYDPMVLLNRVKNIEMSMGRKYTKERYSNRPIDIDILCCGSIVIENSELVVPHPHIKERKFVLKPWSDIDSNYIIANENRKIKELLELTSDSSRLNKICT